MAAHEVERSYENEPLGVRRFSCAPDRQVSHAEPALASARGAPSLARAE